jgi:hypothetical protein
MSIWNKMFGSAKDRMASDLAETVDAKKPLRRAAVAKPNDKKAAPKVPPLRKARKPKMPEHSTGKTYAHNIAAATAARMTKRSGGKIGYEAVKLPGKNSLWTIVGNPIKAQRIVVKRKTPAQKKALQVVENNAALIDGATRANAAVGAATTHLKQLAEYAEMTGDAILSNLVKDALEAIALAMKVEPAKVVTIRKPKEAAALPVAK